MFCSLLHLGYAIATFLHLVLCARNSLEISLYVLPDRRCIMAPPRSVQTHKGLTDKVRIVTEDIGPSKYDHSRAVARLLRLYAEKEETLWIEAHKLCNAFEDAEWHSDDTIALARDVKSQVALASAPETLLPPPPPMTLTPLLVSGPSENRIDLVFFGDGCKYRVLNYPCSHDLAFQTLPKKRVNSSRMRKGWLTISLPIKLLLRLSHY